MKNIILQTLLMTFSLFLWSQGGMVINGVNVKDLVPAAYMVSVDLDNGHRITQKFIKK